MRFPAVLILAFVASGCTIHVVQQPAAPSVLMAEAPRPLRPRHVTYERVAADPTPAAPPRPHAPSVALPARPALPARVPLRKVAVETRDTHRAHFAVPTRKRGPQKVKRPEPMAKRSSTSVAKTQ